MTTLPGPSIDGHRAHLTVHAPRGDAPVDGVVLVLHGGRAKGLGPTSPTQLAVLRMIPFAGAASAAGRRSGARIAVARLRFRVRGWNGARRDPVTDVRWALTALRERFGDAPVALVGHSMGGRTAMAVAGDPGVVAVVGLAPWLGPEDRVGDVRGRRILVMHGTADRMTDPQGSRDWAERARRAGATVTYVAVPGAKHTMLGRARLWQDLAADFAVGVLAGAPSSNGGRDRQDESHTARLTGTARGPVAKLLPEALAGVPFATA